MSLAAPETDAVMTRTAAVMTAIRQRIDRRVLASGEKLPSIRKLAATMQVSPSTVVEAYDRLVAEGVIRSRPGAGFYVAGGLPPLALTEAEPLREREIDPLWVSRQSLDAGADAARPGCGWLPADWMPQKALQRRMRAMARADSAVLTDYGTTMGSLPLRRLLARQAAADGVDVAPDQVLLASSGTQAIDLLCRFLLQPGDAVLVDDPCYFNFQAILRAHRARIVSVPYTRTGPDLEAFAQVLETDRPRLYLTNSALHNPTGATMSPRTAHRILTLAASYDLTIIEDDIFADFEPDPSPRLAALDGLSRVIRIGSFSKTLSASIRCGYIIAKPEWIEGLADLQVATNFGGPSPFAADLVLGVLSDGSYRKHIINLRMKLDICRKHVTTRLEGLGIRPWIEPRGGFYLWSRLPEGVDAADVARHALKSDVVLAPGNVFSAAQSSPEFLRLNIAQTSDKALETLQHTFLSVAARPA